DFLSRFTVFTTTVKRGRHFSDLNQSVKRLSKRFLQTFLSHPKTAYRSSPWHGAHYRAFLNTRNRIIDKNSVFVIVCLLIRLFAQFSSRMMQNNCTLMVADYYLTAKIRLLYLIKAFR
ncbi:MAG TPA: hypothetical protein VLA40_01390, partial [Rheinheimera sp.]|nr:hypothetical protein [Rheinheimera sp.]